MAKRPVGTPIPFDLPEFAPALDPEATDAQIRDQGTRLVHFRAMRCPVGLTDMDDALRRPHQHHADCANGFLYTRAGTVTVAFLGNNRDAKFQDWGRYDDSTAQIVVPRYYDSVAPAGAGGGDDGDDCGPKFPVEMCKFDRLFLDEESITVINWQLFEAHETGRDRLQYPVVRVIDLVDSLGRRYVQGVDFTVANGQLLWAPNKGPGKDPATGRGRVCGVRYAYRPYWYVDRMVHEVRVAQVEGDDGRRLERIQQNALIRREFHFEKEDRDEGAPSPASPRQKPGPEDGGLGPR